MHAWYRQIIQTPLHEGFSLSQLKDGEYRAEMDFHMSLADRALGIRKIRALFEGLKEPDLLIQDLNDVFTARYLTGSIDLVYFDGQHYNIATYIFKLIAFSKPPTQHSFFR